MKRVIIFVLVLISVLITGCIGQSTPAVPPETVRETSLTVMAAASLTEAFTEIGALFEEQHPGVNIIFNFAGSQQLAQQIAQGAPADVFASANQKQMTAIVESGLVEAGMVRLFAGNRLVVVAPRANQVGIDALADLAQPGVKLVLAAAEVPVGQYSLDFLAKASQDQQFGAGYQEAVLQNVVSYEADVRAVLTKVLLDEADAGIVYATDITRDAVERVIRLEIPDELNVLAQYPLAALKAAPNPSLAQAFVDLVLSESGQQILAKYGFTPAP